jgi:hypothetical protein
MGAAAWGLDRQAHLWLPGSALPLQLLRVGIAIGGSLAVLALLLTLLRVTEFTDVTRSILRRLRGRRS